MLAAAAAEDAEGLPIAELVAGDELVPSVLLTDPIQFIKTVYSETLSPW